MVGIKSDEELKAKRYEQSLHENQEAPATQYFELGTMYQKIGNKKAAIEAFLNAANLSVNGEDVTLAMAANKAIVQLDPGHKDALANLAYIRFQYGTKLVNKEYDELLQELQERQKYGLFSNGSEKKVSSKTASPGGRDSSSENEGQSFSDVIAESLEASGSPEIEDSGRLTVVDESSLSHIPESEGSANKLPTSVSKSQSGQKSPIFRSRRAEDRKAELQARKKRASSQRKDPFFEAERKSLIDLIEGTGTGEFSTSFELERQELIDLIKQEEDDENNAPSESQEQEESPLFLKDPEGEHVAEDLDNAPDAHTIVEAGTIEETPEDHWEGPEEVIDLRSDEEKETEKDCMHLHRCVVFSALSDEELQHLTTHVQFHAFDENATVFTEHGTHRSLFVICDGEVELIIRNSSESEELSRLKLVPGDFFGEHTFWKQNTLEVSAAASTACTLGEIPASTFLTLARKYPAMLQFLKRVCKRRYFAAMLAQTRVFQDCSMQERQNIAEYLSPIHVTQGVPIIPEGEYAQDLFIIQSGEVNVFTTFAESEECLVIQDTHEQVSLERLREGDVFGEETFFTNEPCLTTFWAKTDTLLLKLAGPCLATFAEQFPQFRRRLYGVHQQRSQATMNAVQAVLAG